MTVSTFVIAPTYNSFYVDGDGKVEPPLDFVFNGVAATRECVTIPTVYYADSSTTVIVGHVSDLENSAAPNYEGILATPQRQLVITETLSDIAAIKVENTESYIRVWMNDTNEPDHVTIAWSDASTA